MTILLLTRPMQDSLRFLAAVERECGPVAHVISPVMEITPVAFDLPAYDEVILTSVHGVAAARGCGVQKGTRAWCVGARTADAAKDAGFAPQPAARDADALVDGLLMQKTGRLLHIRGEHARGDIVRRLREAGHDCRDVVAYEQRPVAPTVDALDALGGTQPVVLPLFSPRSALLIPAIGQAPIHVIAMSHAVAAEVADLGADTVSIAQTPDFDGMLAATCRRLDAV